MRCPESLRRGDGHAPDRVRVLVVEDDPSIRELLEVFLRHAGFEVSTAADGHNALDHTRRHRPDLVVLDVMIPGIDGIQIADHVVADGLPCRILFLTAGDAFDVATTTGNPDLRTTSTAQAHPYLVKPFGLDDLLARVHHTLGSRMPGPTVL